MKLVYVVVQPESLNVQPICDPRLVPRVMKRLSGFETNLHRT